MNKTNTSGKAAITFETLSVARFLEEYLPKFENKNAVMTPELWEYITGKELADGENPQGQECDNKYQRKYGAWSHTRKCEYIKSVFENRIYTPIVLCNSNLNTPRKESGLASCLDGQHRSQVLAEFVTDQFGYTGTFIVDGKEHSHVNCLFSNLTERERKLFLRHSNIVVGTVAPNRVDLRQCFISINDGEPLNDQEKRNAIECFMSDWARRMGDKHESLWVQTSGISGKIHRMLDREYASKVLVFFENYNQNTYIDLKSTNIDKFYITKKKDSDMKICNYIDERLFASLHTVAQTYRRKTNSKLKIYNFWFHALVHFNIWKNTDVDLASIDSDVFWDWCKTKYMDIEKDSQLKFHPMIEKYERGEVTRDEFTKARNNTFHANVGRIHLAGAAKIFSNRIKEEWDGDWNKCFNEFVTATQPTELKEAV